MRSLPVTRDVLEQMAFDSGRSIELSPNTAYLSINGTTWYALLEPVGGASS